MTDIEDLVVGVNVDWLYSYVSEEFDKTTDYYQHDEEVMENYKNYYGILDEEAHKKTFETKFIRLTASANAVAKYLLEFWKNQHLIVDFTIPISHGVELEVGDIISFYDNISGLKAFGKDIHISYDLLGQNISDYFLITETKKTLNRCSITCFRMHDLDFPEVEEP